MRTSQCPLWTLESHHRIIYIAYGIGVQLHRLSPTDGTSSWYLETISAMLISSALIKFQMVLLMVTKVKTLTVSVGFLLFTDIVLYEFLPLTRRPKHT